MIAAWAEMHANALVPVGPIEPSPFRFIAHPQEIADALHFFQRVATLS
jgi:hypothetical protein